MSSLYPTENLHPHPLSDDVPFPTPEEYDALYEDIRVRGIVEPIEALPTGVILDGRTRHAIALALNLQQVPVRWVDPSDPYDFMIRAALLRRHLTTEQRKKLAGRLLVQAPERSDRQVARETGLSHHTVAAVREEGEATGQIAQLEERIGADGRTRAVAHSPAEMVITDGHRARHPDSVAALEAAELSADLASAINKVRTDLLDPEKWSARVAQMRPEDTAWPTWIDPVKVRVTGERLQSEGQRKVATGQRMQQAADCMDAHQGMTAREAWIAEGFDPSALDEAEEAAS